MKRLFVLFDRNDWEPFEPHTNALWLHYLADKLLKKKKYPKKDKEIETKLKRFLRQAKKCSSATEIVQDCFDWLLVLSVMHFFFNIVSVKLQGVVGTCSYNASLLKQSRDNVR